MKIYKVVMEIELYADSPLEAAKQVQDMFLERDSSWQFYVQEDDKDMFSVDLDAEDDDAVLPILLYNPLIVQPE